MAEGTIFKFHNDLDTDQIIASQYLLLPNLDEMKEHTCLGSACSYRQVPSNLANPFSSFGKCAGTDAGTESIGFLSKL